MPSPITEEEERRIIKMWEERYTGSEIGAALGRTRSSIMGKLNRLRAKGVITLRPEGESRFKPKPDKAGKPVIRRDVPSMPKMPPLKTGESPQADKPVEALFSPPPPPPPKPMKPIKFIALKAMSCRYVVSGHRPEEFLFCGRNKERGAYCEEHAALSYVKLERKRSASQAFKLSPMTGAMTR
jgi:hypothetical protein